MNTGTDTTEPTVEEHNAATTDPAADAEIHEVAVSDLHEWIYAGNGDSLGSLNAVLNKLAKDGRKVLGMKRVWCFKVSVPPPATEIGTDE